MHLLQDSVDVHAVGVRWLLAIDLASLLGRVLCGILRGCLSGRLVLTLLEDHFFFCFFLFYFSFDLLELW